MVDTRKQYVITLAGINGASEDLVGILAKDIETVQKLGINTPVGFVLTTQAFDDFLIANDLLDFISPRINDIDYENEGSVKKASDEIRHAINNAIFPEILSGPILQAYSGLSGFYDAFVSIKQSAINSTLDERSYTDTKVFKNISGKEKLLQSIKEAWSQIFTVEALRHRTISGYEGYVTEALVIQKMLQAEVSGKMYSYNAYDGNQTQVEIQAFFGLTDADLWQDMVPDSYTVSKKSQEIIEKKIIGQDYMFVRKGRANDKNPVIKVPISKLWHKKQKLDDKFILLLFRQCQLLEENLHREIEVSWEFEAGRVYIVDFDIKKIESVEVKQDNEKPVEVEEEEQAKPEKKSVDEYVNEVSSMRKDMTIVSTKSANPDDQIVVNIKPVEELHILAQGKSKGEKLVFGLVHFILSDSDFDNLTGDEILVVRNINPDFYNILNSVRGLIILEDVDSSDLLDITVPLVSGIADAFDVFQENEVVTVRPWNGSVYLGAGKESEDMASEAPKIAHDIDDNEKQGDDEKHDEPNTAKVPTDKGDIIFEPKVKKSAPISATQNEPATLEDLPKTVLDFWQAYYPNQGTPLMNHIDGLVVRVADIMDSYQKDIFESELVSKLINVLKIADGKPVILVSAGRDKMMEEIVEAELNAIAEMRNKDYLRNLWYCFDNIVDVDDLVKLKKLFVSKGFRRSSSLKLYLAVHSPQSFIMLKSFLDSGIDGILVDLDLMFREHGIKVKHNDPHMIEYVAHRVAKISEAKTQSMLLAYEHKIESDVLKELLTAGLNALALNEKEIASLKKTVSEIETSVKTENKKKRGRKRKEIDFGY